MEVDEGVSLRIICVIAAAEIAASPLQVSCMQYHVTNFHLNYAPSKWTYRAKSDFSVPFEVKANEVVYLGEFLATATMLKNSFLIANIDKPYFLVPNQQERDMPIAVEKYVSIYPVPFGKIVT